VGTSTVNYNYTDSNGCSNSAASSIQVTSNPTVTWGTVTTTYCETASPVTLAGGSPAGGVYLGDGVSNGMFDPEAAGTGSHTLTYKYTNQSGCYNTITKNFVVSAIPAISFSMDTVICIYVSPFTLTGGWPAGGIYYINGSPASTFNPAFLGAGYQLVVYKVVSGICNAYDTLMVLVDVCTGNNEMNADREFSIYPNPSSGLVSVETNMSGEQVVLKLFDALGQLKKEFYFSGNEKASIQLDLQDLPSGIYSVQLSNDELRWTKMLVIE
jgi:hypothetical protein